MRPEQLILRCYAERKGDQWQAFCLEFSLAAQGDSLNEARAKLDEQIREYVHDSLVGKDRLHAAQLLSRKAPLRFYLRYAYISAVLKLRGHDTRKKARFKEAMPLVPALC
ncbi:DUF1902 domain-containing protein [Lysobacter maris]|uniref:DUF1902 domain-containing protein n=1 Tax=Marilutibacter maris TaxID=1605891 RepID=A0A508B6A5_9GAMM|nr:DUF1902 domain-containing protein [Lysobacter maris]KAB8198572.1 DUF1902 domain-containing protein [Lysobacter maris]